MVDVSENYIHEWRKKLLCLCTVGEDCLRLLLRFYLNPDPNADTDKELADAFKNAVANKFDVLCKAKINSLNFPSNDKKIYEIDAMRGKVVKDTIIIDELDITFMGDILKNINALKSLTGVQQPCKNGHMHLCCPNHNHKCTICKKLICNNTPKQCCNQNECDHICSRCGNLYSICKRQSIICCNTCNLCRNCVALVPCDNFTLQNLIDIIKKELRNCSMHLTNKECENPDFDFPEVNYCNTWTTVFKRFVDALTNIINDLHSKHYITTEVKDELLLKINKVKTGEAFYKFYERTVEKMMKSEQKYDTLQDYVAEHTKDIHILQDTDAVHTNDIHNLAETAAEHTKDIHNLLNAAAEHSKDIYILQDTDAVHTNDIHNLAETASEHTKDIHNLQDTTAKHTKDFHNLEDMKKDIEHIKRKQHEFEPENQRRDEDGVATRNVLDIIAKQINENWETLSCKLGVNPPACKRLCTINKSYEECLHQCYETLQYNIDWNILKGHLIKMNRNDIIDLVERENTITLGDEKRKENSLLLKRFYKEKLMKWNQPKAFKSKGGREDVIRDRNHVFVQLMMGEWFDVHHNDTEHFLRGMYQQKQRIEMNELLDGDGKFIIIRGIAGIGKTSFVDSFVLNWANGKIYQDYDCVIKLSCRELNVWNNIESLRDLLKRKYPEVGDLMCDYVNDVNVKVLVILDGLDEFRYLKDIININQGTPSDHPLASVVYDLINPGYHPNKKIIVCGRPQASEEIYRCKWEQVTYKLVEIAGFDEENVSLFIDKHFANDKIKAELMKQKLSEQGHLKAMARIPIYAYILCNVLNNGALVEELDTATKLNIASCLVFLRDHMRGANRHNEALINLCKDKVIVQTIRELSKFAYKSLDEQRIIFKENDFCESEYLSSIVDSGIFEKHEGDENGDIYQFKHLVLQEFLCAIHMLNESIDVNNVKGILCFKNSIMILFGLVGLLHDKSLASNYLKYFVKSVIDITEEELSKYDMNVTSIIKSFGTKGEYETSKLLNAVHEYNCDLSKDLQKYFLNRSLSFSISYHLDLQRLAYFLTYIKVKCVQEIKINMRDLSPNEMQMIAPYLVRTERIYIQQIRNIDGYKHFAEEIIRSNASKRLKILTLNCDDERIIELLKSIPYLESLNFVSETHITSVGFNEMSQCIYSAEKRNENSLKQLNLKECSLNDESIISLSKSIPYLKSLNFSGNRDITSIGFNEISQCICSAEKRNENSLKHLNLSKCNLTDDSIITLSKSIPYLESLDLSWNCLITLTGFNEMSWCIGNARQKNKNSLKQLKLTRCNVDCVNALKLSLPYIKLLL